MTQVTSKLDSLKQLVESFEKLQSKHAKLGATDTEPDGEFQVLLVRAVKGKNPTAPTTARHWQLYSEMAGNEEAAQQLGAAAQRCVDFIGALYVTDVAEIRKWLEGYCWRVSW